MNNKQKVILAISLILVVIVIYSLINTFGYSNISNVKISQVFYKNTIEITVENPHVFIAIFPESEFDVYVHNIYYGHVNIEKNVISGKSSSRLTTSLKLNPEGYQEIRSEGYILDFQKVSYQGFGYIYQFGLKSTLPFNIVTDKGEQSITLSS